VRPGDTLKGSCRISTELAIEDSWVEVSLQGKIYVDVSKTINFR